MDTTYFRLRSSSVVSDDVLYMEVDVPKVVQQKMTIIMKTPELQSAIRQQQQPEPQPQQDIGEGSASFSMSNYRLRSYDLCDTSGLLECMQAAGVDVNKPTLFISEVVMVYLPVDRSDALLQLFSSTFTSCAYASYGMTQPHDAYGETMTRNLLSRGIELDCLTTYPTTEHQITRMKQFGFSHVHCVDMNYVYNNYIDADDRRRAERSEFMDEFEEWRMIQEHYCVSVATNCDMYVGYGVQRAGGIVDEL